MTPSSLDVSIEDDGLMATVAGDYTVTYELDGVSADANWTVLAAAAAAVDLQVEDEDLSAGDDVDYEVVVTDAQRGGRGCHRLRLDGRRDRGR